MQLIRELFFTAVVIYVLFKVFGGRKKNPNSGNVFFTQNNFNSKKNASNPNNINQTGSGSNKTNNDDGEYIDYEEIK